MKNELEEQKVRTLFSFCSGGHWSVSLLLTAYPGFESRPGGISNSTVIVVPVPGTIQIMLNRRAREACKKKFTNHLLLLNFRYSICNNVQEKYCILEILLKTFLVFYPWNSIRIQMELDGSETLPNSFFSN